MAEALKGVKVQNVTMTEVMETRSATEVIRALNLIFVKYRSLGIPLYRMHCDRAKEFLSKQVQHWCLEHNLLLTMTSGDDHAANGRVETEVNHVKRRLRVVLKGSGAPAKWWPAALRHVVLQRNQQQLERLGVETFPLLPFYAKVMVKTKRWHKKGPLASPFCEVRLLGPSPLMSWGWVVQTNEGTIQHARAAILPDEEADRARHKLEVDDNPEKPKQRLTGKQRMERGPHLGGDLDHEEGALPQEEDEGPALRELQAGGEYYTGLKKFWLTDKEEKSSRRLWAPISGA